MDYICEFTSVIEIVGMGGEGKVASKSMSGSKRLFAEAMCFIKHSPSDKQSIIWVVLNRGQRTQVIIPESPAVINIYSPVVRSAVFTLAIQRQYIPLPG